MSRGKRKSTVGRTASTARLVRQRHTRTPKDRILVVGDGEKTEPNYVLGMRSNERVRARFVIEVRRGSGGCALDTVKRALAEQRGARKSTAGAYDEVWVLLDVEHADHRRNLEEARQNAESKDVEVILSNPCFEVWLLAHFKRTRRPFGASREVTRLLNTCWRSRFDSDYSKNAPNLYEWLKDLVPTAIENARGVREQEFSLADDTANCNSSTEVYRLVERLLTK